MREQEFLGDLLIERNRQLLARAMAARAMAQAHQLKTKQLELIEQNLKVLPLLRANRRTFWQYQRATLGVRGRGRIEGSDNHFSHKYSP